MRIPQGECQHENKLTFRVGRRRDLSHLQPWLIAVYRQNSAIPGGYSKMMVLLL